LKFRPHRDGDTIPEYVIEARQTHAESALGPFHSPARAQRGAGGQHVHQRTSRGEPTLLMARHPLPAESGQEAVERVEVFVIDRDGQVDVPGFTIDVVDEDPVRHSANDHDFGPLGLADRLDITKILQLRRGEDRHWVKNSRRSSMAASWARGSSAFISSL